MVEALQIGILDAGTFGRHSAIDSRLDVLNLPFLEERVIQLISRYYDDAGLRLNRSQKMQAFIDGFGARRVAEKIVGL